MNNAQLHPNGMEQTDHQMSRERTTALERQWHPRKLTQLLLGITDLEQRGCCGTKEMQVQSMLHLHR